MGGMSQAEYAKNRRRKDDVPTGGFLVCPGSFFPPRTGVDVEGSFIHTVEVMKRNAHHAMCDQCGIQFTLNAQNWKHFQVLPQYCGSSAPIPGISLSEEEMKWLLPHLSDAKLKAIEDWKRSVWIHLTYSPIYNSHQTGHPSPDSGSMREGLMSNSEGDQDAFGRGGAE